LKTASIIFANTKECKPKEWITKSSSIVRADAQNDFPDSLSTSFLSSFVEGIMVVMKQRILHYANNSIRQVV